MADTSVTNLAAAGALDATELYPASQGGNSRKVTGAQIQTLTRKAGSAAAGSWPILGSGTVLGTEVAGAEEYDGTCEYFGLAAASRAVAQAEWFVCLAATHTLDNNGNLQAAFNQPTDTAALTLPEGLYFFDALFYLTSMATGGGSGNCQFDILGAGGAALGTILYHAMGIDGAAATAAALNGSTSVLSASPTDIVTGVNNATLQFSLRGTFRVTTPGTIIPSIKLTTAAAAVVAIGSYFRCRLVGAAAASYCGPWS